MTAYTELSEFVVAIMNTGRYNIKVYLSNNGGCIENPMHIPSID